MMGAGLLAKKAVERGLSVAPHVKTSLAPGSKVVTEYLQTSGLLDPLEQLKFDVVGYGCTTCIGNSGPLAEEISAAVEENDLVVAAVLSGNRNFEGRINPDVRANYLASPPLVVAYALAGTVDIDLSKDPIGEDQEGNPVYLKDIWPSQEEVAREIENALDPKIYKEQYADVYTGNEQWNDVEVPSGDLYEWDPDSTYIQEPSFFKDMGPEPEDLEDIEGARVLVKVGDSVTTDHISPAGAIPSKMPAGQYLIEKGVDPRRLQLLRLPARQPRGHGARHVRQHPPPQPARRARRAATPSTSPTARRPRSTRRACSTRRRTCPSSSSPARSTARAPRATGRPRARSCSASGPLSPRASSASTART